jgi:hypothetical protein
MKRILFVVLLNCFALISLQAQSTEYFVTAGMSYGSTRVEGGGITTTDSANGLYAGAGAIFKLNPTTGIMAELSHMNIGDLNFIQLPVVLTYEFVPKFRALVGTQIMVRLQPRRNNVNNFSGAFVGGMQYDLSKDWFLLGRYMVQVRNAFNGNGGLISTTNFLNVGVGYKF